MFHLENAPAFYSFITYRGEAFGGYLYNPYLLRELALDQFEAAVAEGCDGTKPAHLLAVELGRRFHTDCTTAERRLLSTLSRFQDYCALKWDATDQSRNAPLPLAPQEHHAPTECGMGAQPTQLVAPLSILWEITRDCNLRCLHCLSSCGTPCPQELSTQEAKDLIDELARLRVFSITLGGGEPLTRTDLSEIIAYATENHLGVRLSTNGFNVTSETIRQLVNLNVFCVQISIDGLRETHDLLRGRPGAFDRAINALVLFREAGYHTTMTVTASAMNLAEVPELVDLAARIGVSVFKVGPYVSLGRATHHESQLRITNAGLRALATALRAKQKRFGAQIEFEIAGLFPWLLDPPPLGVPVPEHCGIGCPAGVAQLVVSYDGNVYPCPYMRTNSAGNVRQMALKEIWKNEEYFAPLRTFDVRKIDGKCRTCAYRPELCNCGCRGAALATNGSLYAEDPHCWLDA